MIVENKQFANATLTVSKLIHTSNSITFDDNGRITLPEESAKQLCTVPGFYEVEEVKEEIKEEIKEPETPKTPEEPKKEITPETPTDIKKQGKK